MMSPIFLLLFYQEVHSRDQITIPVTSAKPTATTTASALYCDADKCDRHAVLIYDLEQKVNFLTQGFEILENQNQQLQNATHDLRTELDVLKDDNEALNRENKMIKEDLQVLKEENNRLKIDNEVLQDDVKELQG